jgi:hypothetical protein
MNWTISHKLLSIWLSRKLHSKLGYISPEAFDAKKVA